MFYDLSYLLPWLLLALVLGGFIGWRTEGPGEQGPLFVGPLRNFLIALAALFLIALFGIFPGRFGFWFETLVWFAVAYVAGALIGGAVKRVRSA